MKIRKYLCIAAIWSLLLSTLSGCGNSTATEDTGTEEATTETTTEVVVPTGRDEYRKIADELPERKAPVENPGTREHFSFTVNDKKYVFTETETLWMYNQSEISTCDTQFMLNVKDYKVTIAIPEAQELEGLSLDSWACVYTDDIVSLYRENDSDEVAENEVMYLKLYDMTYRVDYWSELVTKKVISLKDLYTALAQMGTAIVPAGEDETLSTVIEGLGANPVLDDFKLAYREGVPYSGFIFCSPSSGNANHDSVSILMSIEMPGWEEYATVHIEGIPDYRDRLEDTGETFEEYPVLVDYTGELRYFVLGNDGKCIYLDGMPGQGTGSGKNFTAAEAAYIFRMVLTRE